MKKIASAYRKCITFLVVNASNFIDLGVAVAAVVAIAAGCAWLLPPLGLIVPGVIALGFVIFVRISRRPQ